MGRFIEPNHIDKPWKVVLWIYGIDAVLMTPLRFARSYFEQNIDSLLFIRFVLFLLAVFFVGFIYVKATGKKIDKHIRFRVALYITLVSALAWLVFSFLFGALFASVLGGLLEGILTTVATFLLVYFILPLANRFVKKK